MKKELKYYYLISISFFLVWLTFWLYLQIFVRDPTSVLFAAFSDSYGAMALISGVIAFAVAQKWGGMKSLVGKAIFMFAIGLLLQAFGQITYTVYAVFLQTDVPYPSLGDVGYFGSIPFYAYGAWLLGKVSGSYVTLQKHKGNILWILLIPAIILYFSYKAFLIGYEFDWNYPLVIFMDFGYPLGQAYYISLAILAYILTRKLLGGMMKSRVLLILLALVIQYVADYMFLYQYARGTWYPGGINDLTYLIAYFVMTIAIIKFTEPYERLVKGNKPKDG